VRRFEEEGSKILLRERCSPSGRRDGRSPKEDHPWKYARIVTEKNLQKPSERRGKVRRPGKAPSSRPGHVVIARGEDKRAW